MRNSGGQWWKPLDTLKRRICMSTYVAWGDDEDMSTAQLVLVDQSGAKQSIPQPSTARAMMEAERAIRRLGRHLREVKVVSRNTAIARWKADELHWERMA